MRKIKLLFVIILCVFIVTFLQILSFFYPFDLSQISFNSTIEIMQFTLYVGALLALLLGYLIIAKGLWELVKQDIFNSKSVRWFSTAGILLIASGLIILLVSLYNLGAYQEMLSTNIKTHLFDIIKNTYSIIIGLGLLILSDFIKSGNSYKQENDLTI